MGSGLRGLGLRGLGFRGLGFRGLGARGDRSDWGLLKPEGCNKARANLRITGA